MIPRIIRNLPDGNTIEYAWFQAMHTRVDILLKGIFPTTDTLVALAEKVRHLILDIEKEGNSFNPESLLSQFNALETNGTIDGGKYLYNMLSECRHYHALTFRLFDVTAESTGHSTDTINGIGLLDNNVIQKKHKNIKVNLSGFIKGYAIDRIKELLLTAGIDNALVNMGNSSVMAMGNVAANLPKTCITTSGNTAGRPWQIIDPRTGAAISHAGTVQVATDSGAEGEALATAFFIAATDTAIASELHNAFPHAIVKYNHD